MFSVSKESAPPFSMISPFFWIGSIFYLLSTIFLLFLTPENGHYDLAIVGWMHWFLLGFMMMIIFGAMAQLIPVVVEVGHFSVDLYYVIWPILLIGTIVMSYGFWFDQMMLPYGGLLVLVSMLIFLFDTLMTLRKATNITLTVKTVVASNLFLLIGIIIGFVMSLTISGETHIDITNWLGAHVVMVLGGYVTLTIMGLSMILLPMFGLSHGFDDKPIERAFKLMVGGVILYFVSTMFAWGMGKFISLIIMLASITLYMYQISIIYETRARKEVDIWVKSMFVGYGSLVISSILGFTYMLTGYENFLISSIWFLIMGFFSFLINGHLYKIIPFLVWFERYSPLVGKEKVPMLNEMLPHRLARFEFIFSSLGITVAGVGLLIGSNDLFKGGVVFVIAGAGFMLISVKWMLNYGK
ncbi:hypothetical protein MNB_SV-6-421 [hydrothermal vent metagenome]|uniref:Transmembrane protein n=1 Tax=hydrothermal vent metagenome TaxID=652676 RepID=A0A1W1B9G4_9ZZZZ